MSTAAEPSVDYALFDRARWRRELLARCGDDAYELALSLPGLHCGGCVRRVEGALAVLPGLEQVQVNLNTRRANLVWRPRELRFGELLAALRREGFEAHPYDPRLREHGQRVERRQQLKRLAVAGFASMQVMMLAVALYAGEDFDLDIDDASRGLLRWASLLLSVPVLTYCARPFFANALAGLRRGRLVMDLPVALAIAVGFSASAAAVLGDQPAGAVYFDSVCMFTFLLLLGRFLEHGARVRAAAADEDLDRLRPAVAERLDAGGGTQSITVAELAPGDRVLVRPGKSVPADGRVEHGRGSVDESLLSGESLAVAKRPGSRVIGGTLNIESPLTVRVERVGADTVLAGMRRLLTRARAEKPRLAGLADRVAGCFVAALLIIAAAVYLYWTRAGAEQALSITLSVLVVSCPCALSLATPAALSVATGALARLGLLAGRGHALETLARCDTILFDKTGTLTRGRPQLCRRQILSELPAPVCLRIAAALERHSEHPLARALLRHAGARHGRAPAATRVRAVPGSGVEGEVDGRRYRVGSIGYVAGLCAAPAPAPAGDDGASVVALADGKRWLALFHFDDAPRADAALALAELHGLGLRLEILSGDRNAAVARVAAELGVEAYHGQASPQRKLTRLAELQRDGAIVAAVGDGVNDSPLLARAQVSVAMAGGTELARGNADLVLLGGRLGALPEGVRLARRSLWVICQNLFWAIAYNAIAVPLAAAGYLTPWLAALGMSASSLLVTLNALRLARPPRS